MKLALLGLVLSLGVAGAATAQPYHHRHHHRVCTYRHHHRVCRWR